MKHELNWAHNTIFVFPPLFVCMPLHLLDALALVLKDDRCRCHILDLLGISGKTKSGTDKGNLYHCIRSYQQIKDHQRSSKIIKAYQSMLDQQMGKDHQDMPGWAKVRRFSMILHPDPVARSSWTWCASIRCASVPPSTCWAYRCCMHLHAVVVLSCGHGAGWDEG